MINLSGFHYPIDEIYGLNGHDSHDHLVRLYSSSNKLIYSGTKPIFITHAYYSVHYKDFVVTLTVVNHEPPKFYAKVYNCLLEKSLGYKLISAFCFYVERMKFEARFRDQPIQRTEAGNTWLIQGELKITQLEEQEASRIDIINYVTKSCKEISSLFT